MLTTARKATAYGFSLVELLVVMGIISILIGLTFPALQAMRERANTAKCESNLRQIGLAMLSFAGENNNNLPVSGAVIVYNQVDPVTGQNGWTQQLEPYLGVGSAQENYSGTSIYQCPDRSLVPNNKYYSYFNGAHAAYAQSGTACAVNLSKIHNPSALIMAGDIAFNGAFTIDDADKDDYTQDPAFNGYTTASSAVADPIPLHNGSVNLVFADGHVENVRKFDPSSMTTFYQGPNSNYTYLSGP